MSAVLQAKLIAFVLTLLFALWKVFLSGSNRPARPRFKAMQPTVSFSTEGRSGQVMYEGPEGAFSMYWEFGTGQVIAIIDVPSAAHWEVHTQISLAKRMDILHEIGRQTVQAQTSGGRGSYEIQDSSILIKSR